MSSEKLKPLPNDYSGIYYQCPECGNKWRTPGLANKCNLNCLSKKGS